MIDDQLTLYLWNPISQGAYHSRICFSGLAPDEYLKRIEKHIPSKYRRELKREKTPLLRSHVTNLRADITKFGEAFDLVRRLARSLGPDTLGEFLSDSSKEMGALLEWISFVSGDKEIASVLSRKSSSLMYLYHLRSRLVHTEHLLPNPDLALPKQQDAIHVSTVRHNSDIILDITSVKEASLDRYLKFLSDTPEVGSSIRIITPISVHHSSRVVLEPYVPAVSAWTKGRVAVERIPKYLLEYFEAAVQYYDTQEWRTSIVLSAIALESLLAEMFEHEFREEAPDSPLGGIKDEILRRAESRKVPAFPHEIHDWVKKTNETRISAVHRGVRLLSGREALDALRGSVKFALWYHWPRPITVTRLRLFHLRSRGTSSLPNFDVFP